MNAPIYWPHPLLYVSLQEDLDNRAEAVRKEPEFHSQQSLYADTDQLYPDATQSSYDLGVRIHRSP